MEDTEKMEGEHFNRVGRKLNSMLEEVKVARTVPKLVRIALAEAMDALRYAMEARKERLEAKSQWMKLIVGKETGDVEKIGDGEKEGNDRLSVEIKEIKKPAD